jgi:hypothetical protein
MIWDNHPGSGFFPIPCPGFRGQKSTGSRIQIRNTVKTVNSNIPKTLGRVRGGATCTPFAAQRSTRNWSASADSSSSPGAGNCFPVALCSAGRNSTCAYGRREKSGGADEADVCCASVGSSRNGAVTCMFTINNTGTTISIRTEFLSHIY